MKNNMIFLFFISASFTFGQNATTYNTQKNFIAKGYDVVEYFSNKAIKGEKSFVTEHDGVKYKFASKENQDKFEANPDAYIPQYGGYCAYAIGVNGKKVDINPKTFEIRDGKLYLFYNSFGINTLEKWLNENPEKLQSEADTNWQKIIE